MSTALSAALEPTKTVNLATGEPEAKREEIRRYFHATFDVYEKLFEHMACDEAYYQRADPLRHPLIFYYGHSAVFYVNKLVLGKILKERINPEFESTFAVGVDEMSWDDLNDAHYSWPKVAEVKAYRDQVRAAIDQIITESPLTMPIGWDSPFWIIMMGIEHERIHLETSSVLMRQLPLEMVRPIPEWKICDANGEPPANELLPVAGGEVTMGKDRTHPLYGWDNEYGEQTEAVTDFKASKFLVSHREYHEFMQDGGYTTERWWTPEGWGWVTYEKAEAPRFWVRDAETPDQWKLRTVAEVIDLPWNWPAEVNYLEAKAFCNWKAEKTGRPVRLPTEAEWYRLHAACEVPDEPEWDTAPGNLNLEGPASSVPVDTHEFSGGFHDVIGNVWQHTETPIAGFRGFEVHPLYDDFSTPTFDTQHNLIKGGSWISTGNEATRDSRYAFRRHFYQHAGFRYVESEAKVTIKNDVYESDPEVCQWCDASWGENYFEVPNYAQRLAAFALEATRDRAGGKALVLGCKAGRTVFELAKDYDHVLGLDSSARLIRRPIDLQEKGYLQYTLVEEGEIVSFHEKALQDYGLTGLEAKVEFMQADPCNIKELYTGFDLVIVDRMVDHVVDPRKMLAQLAERTNSGATVIITTTNDWDEARTPRDAWLGGYKDNTGENVTSHEGLTAALAPAFEQVGQPADLPYVLRHQRRRFEHGLAQATVWRKKA
ncbi:MAG: 5-histidylcysteine sulfoxide synthase [Verrucomicrobiota bacterium]